MTQEILQIIQDAEMVLVGIGEEFEDFSTLKKQENYQQKYKILEEKAPWAIPMWNSWELEHSKSRVLEALKNLTGYLQDKNYFVISTVTNDIIEKCELKKDHIVSPCGGSRLKQCIRGCQGVLQIVDEQEKEEAIQKFNLTEEIPDLGKCPNCGEKLVLNNIYAENYKEEGYLEQWKLYTKWLQSTLFHKLCILELGVGMQYPSVIRFPFEKVGYFNQKARFIRVNGYLYHLTQELKERGISIAQNAVEWLL